MGLPVLGGLAACGLLLLRLGLQESAHPRPGTFEFWYLIDDVVADAPLLEPLADPSYLYSCGDGPKPMSVELEYRSRAREAPLVAAYRTYLAGRGFEGEENGTASSHQARNARGELAVLTILDPGSWRVVRLAIHP